MMETPKENKKAYKKYYISIIIISLLTVFVSMCNIWYMKIKTEVERIAFYPGISMEDIDLRGMEYEYAKNLLNQKFEEELQQKTISLVHREKSWDFTYRDMGGRYEFEDKLQEVYQIGREGSTLERYRIIQELSRNPQNVSARFSYDIDLVKQRVKEIAEIMNQKNQNATIERRDGQFHIREEVVGRIVNEEKALEEIKSLMSRREAGTIQLVIEDSIPRITKKELQAIHEVIDEFSTVFNPKDIGRTENLRVAADKVNGTLLMPGDVFSLDKVLGPRTEANGYKAAKVIVNNELVDGIAGGVCQIASTIYNTSLLADMEIVERKPHSLISAYIPPGRDATIAENLIDFKFKNNYETPVYIEAKLLNNKVYVAFYGDKKHMNRKITFITETLNKYPPLADEIIKDPNLYVGEEKIEKRGVEGIKVRLYKVTNEDGKMISKEPVDVSYYPPIRGRRRVGTKVR